MGRKDDLEKPQPVSELENVRRRARGEDLEYLFRDPLPRTAQNRFAHPPHQPGEGDRERKSQKRGILHGTDHADGILRERGLRTHESPEPARTEIGERLHVVDEVTVDRTIVEGIDREIASPGILLHRAVVRARVRGSLVPRGGAGDARPESADLDVLLPRAVDVDEPEAPADHAGGPEETLDLQRVGVRGDVEILGSAAHEQVPDRPANDVGVKTGAPQPLDDPQRVRIDEARIYPVLLLSIDVSLLLDASVFRCAVSEKHDFPNPTAARPIVKPRNACGTGNPWPLLDITTPPAFTCPRAPRRAHRTSDSQRIPGLPSGQGIAPPAARAPIADCLRAVRVPSDRYARPRVCRGPARQGRRGDGQGSLPVHRPWRPRRGDAIRPHGAVRPVHGRPSHRGGAPLPPLARRKSLAR